MIINSIEFENFRQFKKTHFEFSTDPEKKISIIIGDNTFGKTTIVRAFLWCLYQVNNFEDKILLNSDAQDELIAGGPTATCKVVIDMEHKNCRYRITTSNRYYRDNSGRIRYESPFTTMLKVFDDGAEEIPSTKVSEEINNILGSELKDFFFYDGENNKIEDITNNKRSKLKDSISKIIGIERLEILKSYYDESLSNSVISKLKGKLITNDELDASELKFKIENLKNEILKDKEDIETSKDEIDNLEEQYREKESLITGNADVIELQKEKKNAQADFEKNKNKKIPTVENLQNVFNCKNAFLKSLFAYNFKVNNLEKDISEAKFTTNTSYKYINEKAIDQLIEMGYCICGAPIVKDGTAYHHLIESKNHMEPHDFGKYASDFSDSEKQNEYAISSILTNIQEVASTLNSVLENIEEADDRYKKLVKALDGRADVGAYQREASAIRSQIDTNKGKIQYIESKLPEKEDKIKDLQIDLDSLTSKNDENDFINHCIDYCNYIVKSLSKKINSSKSIAREKLEKLVDDIFQEMYSYPGQRKIHIDNDFIATCDLVSGKSMEKSTGLKTVQNYAFVAGLMELIRQKIVSGEYSEGNEDTIYPLVMDAPFSSTDDNHIANICKVLPKYSNQIIICVMRKDFESAKKQIADRIGKEYTIKKESESSSIAKEVK